MRPRNLIFLLTLFLAILIVSSCGRKGGNPVFNYLKNSELKYDNKVQRDNIMQAIRDAIMLSPDDLKQMKYKDYAGNDDKWDLQTLFTHHFVLKQPGLTWGNDFYHDIKQDSVQAFISHILVTY